MATKKNPNKGTSKGTSKNAGDQANAAGKGGAVVKKLTGILSKDRVLTDKDSLASLSNDVYAVGQSPLAVIRPADRKQLAAALAAAHTAGLDVVPRGGGYSYTAGYLTDRPGFLLVDMRDMKRIEVHPEDMYIKVETGATWAEVDAALAPHNLRTPYWGPLSGLRSTVGGALSQHSLFLGSGLYGLSADAALGMVVALADGTLLPTGSLATGRPFMRHYGPDATGLFAGDCGAMGIKVEACLRLVSRPAAQEYMSWSFEQGRDLFAAMAKVARSGLASECFAFDPFLQGQRMKRESLAKDVKVLTQVIGNRGGLAGLISGARMALAGRRILPEECFSMHVSVEGASRNEVLAKAASVRQLLRGGNGMAQEPTVPKAMRAMPFGELTSMIGPLGERWVPVHGLVPMSAVAATWDALQELWASEADAIAQHNIGIGCLMSTASTQIFLFEPVFYWRDSQTRFSQDYLPAETLGKLQSFDEDLPARELVARLRQGVVDVFGTQGATHLQLGRTYPWRERLDPASSALMDKVKSWVDSDGRMNPGVLGFGDGGSNSADKKPPEPKQG